MKESLLNKCWGYYDVSAGGVRLTYQDLRPAGTFNFNRATVNHSNVQKGNIVCHGDKVITGDESMITVNATRYFQEVLFHPNAKRYPDVIFTQPLYLWTSSKDTTANPAENMARLSQILSTSICTFLLYQICLLSHVCIIDS